MTNESKITNFITSYHKRKPTWQNKIAYLSGLIDGEGCLRFYKCGSIRLTIGMTDKKTIYWIYDTFGGQIYKNKIKSGKIFYQWSMHQGKDLYYLLLLCIPFLITKQKIAIKGFENLLQKLKNKKLYIKNLKGW
jgi:hypothetical protein